MLQGRVVVISPHLDDAVLSLGATIARAARSGADVEVLTVLAGDTSSREPAGQWDALAGFAEAGEAARARRAEDAAACRIVGASARWLDFTDKQYGQPARSDVREAVASAVRGATLVLVPGFPLEHPDHAWLSEVLVLQGLPAPLALYVEWPYAYAALRSGGRAETPEQLREAGHARFMPSRLRTRDLVAKWRAVRSYRSQLPLLDGFGLPRGPVVRRLWAERRAGGEMVGWLSDRAFVSPSHLGEGA